MKMLNFGSCNIDYVYSVEHIVLAGETVSADKMEIFPGGKGLNQSIAAARAGGRINHAGYIGTDGGMLADILQNSGVDISFLKRAEMKNGHAVIQVDKNGENSIFIHKGTNGMISREFVDEVLSSFDSGDILLLQNEINNVSYIIDKAYEKGMLTVLNPSPIDENIKNVDLNKISYLLLNDVEAKAYSLRNAPDESLDYFIKNYPDLKIVLTLGKQGSIYADRTQMFSFPAYNVQTVDTTAAGDTFTGYFIALLAEGRKCEDCIKYATAAAALAVSRMGAASSIPLISEVEEFLKIK